MVLHRHRESAPRRVVDRDLDRAVVRPGSTAEVAQVVQACAAHGASIVPQGGNTGLVVGSVPDDSGTQVVVSLQRMNAVRAIDVANLTLTVEAGAVLQAVQGAAEQDSPLSALIDPAKLTVTATIELDGKAVVALATDRRGAPAGFPMEWEKAGDFTCAPEYRNTQIFPMVPDRLHELMRKKRTHQLIILIQQIIPDQIQIRCKLARTQYFMSHLKNFK